MRTHNHQVRTDVELVVSGSAFHRFHPSANIHIRDTDAIDARRAPGEAVLKPAQEDAVEAPRLIVRIARNCRETGPLARAITRNAIFAPQRRRPVEQRRVFGDEYRSSKAGQEQNPRCEVLSRLITRADSISCSTQLRLAASCREFLLLFVEDQNLLNRFAVRVDPLHRHRHGLAVRGYDHVLGF